MTEHETNLRDLAAMFAMCGLIMRNDRYIDILDESFKIADKFMEERLPKTDDVGIAAIKPRKKTKEAT
jgi:hypothetical protein